MTCVPADKLEVESCATQLFVELTKHEALPKLLAPSINWTVPVGVPAVALTVAVNKTVWPTSDGLADEETLVDVAAGALVKPNCAVPEIPFALAVTL